MQISLRLMTGAIAATIATTTWAQQPDMEALARDLAAAPPAGACSIKLEDGTCPDVGDTRQVVLGGGGRAVASAPQRLAKAIRQNISMTFVLGSAELTADARAKLQTLARALAAVQTYRPFTVEGHTDRSGPQALNRSLSQARANAVVTYLAQNGVDSSRMTARGYGYDRLIPGRNAQDPANRRVEVTAR